MTVSINGTSGVTFSDASSQNTAATGFGFKNRLINPSFEIAQRATSATVTAGTSVPTASTGYPCVDRWFIYSTGANVTAAYVAGVAPNPHMLQITGAASVTAVGVGQRIEANNSADLAGSTCTLSVDLANSVLTTVTWTASYANTADTFGTIGTPTKTQIATGTFIVNSTMTRYSTNISVPSAATTGIEILFTVGAQISGTWSIDNVQFEQSATATSFGTGIRPYGTELALCQRYYTKFIGSANLSSYSLGEATSSTKVRFPMQCPVTMRSSPTFSAAGSGFVWAYDRIGSALTSLTLDVATTQIQSISATGSALTTGQAGTISAGSYTDTSMSFSAEL